MAPSLLSFIGNPDGAGYEGSSPFNSDQPIPNIPINSGYLGYASKKYEWLYKKPAHNGGFNPHMSGVNAWEELNQVHGFWEYMKRSWAAAVDEGVRLSELKQQITKDTPRCKCKEILVKLSFKNPGTITNYVKYYNYYKDRVWWKKDIVKQSTKGMHNLDSTRIVSNNVIISEFPTSEMTVKIPVK